MSDVLRPLVSKKKFSYATFDIETKEKNSKEVLCCGFFDGEAYFYFKTIKEMVDHFLTNKYNCWTCFAHNGSGFDFGFLFDMLQQHYPQYTFRIQLIGNDLAIVKIRKSSSDHRFWTFADSLKLLPMGQADLTKSFAVEHKKMEEVDRCNLKAVTDEELRAYNECDCRGLFEVLKKFETWFEKLGVPLRYTIASQAMATYRSMMKFCLPCLKKGEEAFIREGYHGGRVEVYKMRCRDKLYVYDFKSLYPYIMKKYPMPFGKGFHISHFDPNKIGFYRAEIESPETYLPSLPFFTGIKLLFPYGKFKGIYSSIELKRAVELGCDVKIKEGYVYSSKYLFDDYVDKFFKMKEDAGDDQTTRAIAKLLLVSLYGKFAQNRETYELMHSINFREFMGWEAYNEDLSLWKRKRIALSKFIIPNIANWITSCGRDELFGRLLKAGEENIYYADTDSIFTTKKLPSGNKLGNLDLQNVVDEAIFLQPKTYILKTEDKLIIKAKGFEKDFTHNLTIKAYEDALYGNPKAFMQNMRKLGKIKECIVREHSFVAVLDKKKTMQSVYDKRKVLPNLDTKALEMK